MHTMSGAKLDVIWSPVHHDKFIIWGPDITLYEVSNIQDIEKKTTFVPISSTLGATVVASHSANGVRCVDISAISELPDPLLALGYANGRVVLSSLKQTYDPLGLVGREFVPKYPRLCNSVSWSHVEANMLAVAMEKHRSDHCILLWDVNRGLTHTDYIKEGVMQTSAESPKPLAEMGLSETAHSVSWSNCSNRTLIASMNLKFIKIFDLRDWSNKSVSTATSRYCYGACADPFNPWQIATRGDSVACVWDARALHAPVLTLPHSRPLLLMQWCPTRRNLLLTLQRDSNSIRLHDIQQANNESKINSANSDALAASAIEAEAAEWASGAAAGVSARALQRDVTPAAAAPAIAAFSCHPADPRRLLAATSTGSIVDYTVCERVTVAWGGAGGCGGGGALAWTAAGGTVRTLSDDFYASVDDISHTMKRRAQTDYGLKPDLWQNADLADDEELSKLWHFLALSKSLVEDGCIRGLGLKHPGVRAVLRGEGGGYRSEIVPSLLPDLPNRRVTVYRSAERQRALQLCGWGWGWENASTGVECAEAEGKPCRAAALAAFHLRVSAALDLLARAAEPQLRVAALALAGLGEVLDTRLPLARAAVARGAGDGGAGAAGPVPARADVLPGGLRARAPRAVPARARARRAPRASRLPGLQRRAERDRHAPGRPRGVRVHVPPGRAPARVRAAAGGRARLAGLAGRRAAHRRQRGGPVAAAALGGALRRRAVRGAGGGALRRRRPAARRQGAALAAQLPVRAGQLAAVVGAVRARHVGVRRGGGRRGGGRGGRRGAARGRGLHLLRQVRGRPAAAPRAPAPARAPAAARRQDEANLVVSELPQAAAALQRVLAAPGHGGRGRGRGRRGGRLPRLVRVVRGLQARRARAAPHAVVQRARGVPGELVQLPLQLAGPARPPARAPRRLAPARAPRRLAPARQAAQRAPPAPPAPARRPTSSVNYSIDAER